MREGGHLTTDSNEDPLPRGVRYFLTAEARATVEASETRTAAVASLSGISQMLEVDQGNDPQAVAVALSGDWTEDVVAWSALLTDGWLMALSPSAGGVEIDDFKARLEDAGCTCRWRHVAALVSGRELQQRAKRRIYGSAGP